MSIDQYALMGNPIAHSLSPAIHEFFAEQTSQQLSYKAILVENDFEQAVEDFRLAGGKGLNITVPYKQQAWQLCDRVSERAQLAQAVNTIIFRGKEIYGDNTDGIGLVTDFEKNLHCHLHNKRILILGAGGAVRGCIGPLLACEPQSITIANRTVEKAVTIAERFHDLGVINGCGFNDLVNKQFDIIINGSAASLSGGDIQLDSNILASDGCCYHMMYGEKAKPFLQWAKKNKATICSDGLGMLVEQAAAAFTLWRQITPSTTALLKQLRTQFE